MNSIFISNPTWDSYQKKVFDLPPPNLIVMGCAGSGKTLLTVYLAKKIIEGGGSVCILVFTKALVKFIKEWLSEIGVENVDVFYERQWDRKNFAVFDYYIVDEAQDFSLKDIERIQCLAKKGIYVLGDDSQNIYKENFHKEPTLTLSELERKTNWRVVKLSENYRIPKSIVNFINAHSKSIVMQSGPEHGALPIIKRFETVDEELSWIANYIKELPNKTVGILLKKNESSLQMVQDYKEIVIPGIKDTVQSLKDKGIEVGYKDSNDTAKLNFEGVKNINVLSYKSAKALQFDIVILPFMHYTNVGVLDKNLTYVGLTRPMQSLIITYTGYSFFSNSIDKRLYDGEIAMHPLQADFEKATSEFEKLLKAIK